MTILIIGNTVNLEECKLKFGTHHNFIHAHNLTEAPEYFSSADVIFDFDLENNPEKVVGYGGRVIVPVFFSTTKVTLTKLLALGGHPLKFPFFGLCGLPTFINRPILEVSLSKKEDQAILQSVCSKLNTQFLVVEDRVGMVTPRVICMIINEAYLTCEEGIASRADIDLAMKLGTNYPFGPFEWCVQIGMKNVCDLLQAVQNETRDDRYKISALLQREAQTGV